MAMNQPDNNARIIVVIGATGQQGGAVARALAATGRWRVRAVVRNPASSVALCLRDHGIEVIHGNMDRPESLSAALAGAYGVYAMQPSVRGTEIEIRQGAAIIDAACFADIRHFIYASVGGADRQSGVPHFESKWVIEQNLVRSGLPATVIRPAFFMENFVRLPLRIVLMALPRRYMPRHKPLQMIAIDDIGNDPRLFRDYPQLSKNRRNNLIFNKMSYGVYR
ncbi:NmrA/HSCARG family protein [Acerihabitans sp.]|uniref:NmrA/HSCARG family protein n=1 Tax=Acerihabitans sp. TaxID=2811394 RepID=UPI002EDB914C